MRACFVGTRLSAMVATVAFALTALTACDAPQPNRDIRLSTDDLNISISVSPMPPRSEDLTEFKIFVQDKETGQPIETGEGRIFATSLDKANTYDGLAKSPELGMYSARIRFPMSGDWAVGLQFRRDSTQRLQRTLDWIQTVRPARPLGDTTTP